MTTLPANILTGLLLMTVFSPLPASAQNAAPTAPAESFRELEAQVKPGSAVYVIDAGGTRWRGSIERVTSGSLSLRVGAERRDFSEGQVATVRRVHDDLFNGVLIGAAVGGGLFAFAAGNTEGSDSGSTAALLFLGAGIGAGVGLGLDALFQNGPVIFRARGKGVQVIPQVSIQRRGAGLTLRF
jgi:hypothetical protein